MSYSIELVSTPTNLNEKALDIVRDMDRKEFPGCEVERLRESWVWLAKTNKGLPVGYASMRYLALDKCGYFSRAAVKVEHRRKGLHKRLIRCRVNWAKRMGWEGVLTYTHSENNASANSLINLGFRLYNPQYRWAGKEFLYFSRSF